MGRDAVEKPAVGVMITALIGPRHRDRPPKRLAPLTRAYLHVAITAGYPGTGPKLRTERPVVKKAPFIFLATAIASLGFAEPVLAQAARTFVSGHGSDSNSCSLASPCRTFAQALTQTNPGGEIAVLDTAGYGSMTITKAVSIINQDGVEAGVTAVSTGDGITVAAGANDVVNLRGLTVVGGGIGTSGITFTSGRSLNIDKCWIRDFTAGGISMVTTNDAANLTVTETTVSNNFQGVYIGVNANNGGTATLSRLHATGNGSTGISATPILGEVKITVTDSLLDNNGTGIAVSPSALANAFLTVDNSKLFEKSGGTGISAVAGNGVILLNRSFFGYANSNTFNGAVVRSFGNNQGFDSFFSPITF